MKSESKETAPCGSVRFRPVDNAKLPAVRLPDGTQFLIGPLFPDPDRGRGRVAPDVRHVMPSRRSAAVAGGCFADSNGVVRDPSRGGTLHGSAISSARASGPGTGRQSLPGAPARPSPLRPRRATSLRRSPRPPIALRRERRAQPRREQLGRRRARAACRARRRRSASTRATSFSIFWHDGGRIEVRALERVGRAVRRRARARPASDRPAP